MVEGWILLDPDKVPERWRERARLMAVVPLLPGEDIATEGTGSNDGEDPQLLRLLAQGRSTDAIAAELRISTRSVQRAIARLRKRFDVGSKAELSAALSKAGF